MARLTRNSYKRRIIIFGIMLFMGIALVSTGFAAWIMSSNAKAEGKNTGSVGVVNDSSLQISDLKLTSGGKEYAPNDQGIFVDGDGAIFNFAFEPLASDNTGRVRYDGSKSQVLECTISGRVAPKSFLNKIYIQLVVPTGVANAASDTYKYVVLPVCVESPADVAYTDQGESVTFSYDIEFTWGEAFNGQNPGEYFDKDAAGQAVSDSSVVETLRTMRAVMRGANIAEYLVACQQAAQNNQPDPDLGSDLEFTIIVSADVN